MTEFDLPPYRLLVDVEANRAYYGDHPLPWVTCDCSGCRNFVRAVKTLPTAVTAFFAALGLDPEKPAETMYYTGGADGVSGGGWYHLQGELLRGVRTERGFPPEAWIEISPEFSVAFHDQCALVPEDFPRPCLQMEADYRLPWLLEEPNPYDSST